MDECEQHTFQLLTKRPERMNELLRYYINKSANIWLGTTIENQNQINRGKYLYDLFNFQVRFISYEPLISETDSFINTSINWVIVGAESGRNARPMNEDWVRKIRDKCIKLDIPFFYKQRMENGKKISMPELDGQIWNQMPKGLSL